MPVTEEQLTVKWVQAISTGATDVYAKDLLSNISASAENAADLDTITDFLARTPLAAEVLASSQSWELLDALCTLAERVNEAALAKCAGSVFVHVRARELVLMACERMHDQKDPHIFILAAYVLQIAISKRIPASDLLSSLQLTKITATELVKGSNKKTVIAGLQSFLLGAASRSAEWHVYEPGNGGNSSFAQRASLEMKGTEAGVYVIGLALAVLQDLVAIESDESVVNAMGLFVLELSEALGVEAEQLIGQPFRLRDALWAMDRPRKIQQEASEANAGAVTDAERSKLRTCIDTQRSMPASLADVVSWKHLMSFSIPSEADEDADDDENFASVRSMKRVWIPARHVVDVLSCFPPMEWGLRGVAVCAYLALRREAWVHIASPAWLWDHFIPHVMALLHTNSLVAVHMGAAILDTIIARQSFASYPAGGFLVYVDVTPEYDDAAAVRKLKTSPRASVEDSFFLDSLILSRSTDSLGLLQLIVNALTHDPVEDSRQAMYRMMDKLFCLFEPQSRLRLLKRLIEDCPYHNVVGLLIDRAQREIQKLWSLTGKFPDDVFTEAYTVKKIASTIKALSNASFDDIASEMDTYTAILALLRFLLLRDTDKSTYIHKPETLAQLQFDVEQASERIRPAIADVEEKARNGKSSTQLGGVPVFKFYLLQESLDYLRSLLQ